jgi:hypothetical protein
VGKPKRHGSTEPAPTTGDDGNSSSKRQFLTHLRTTPLLSAAQGVRPWRDADTARECNRFSPDSDRFAEIPKVRRHHNCGALSPYCHGSICFTIDTKIDPNNRSHALSPMAL